MSESDRKAQPSLLQYWKRLFQVLPGRSGPAAARRLRRLVAKGELPLDAGLEKLRRVAASIRPTGRLLHWGRERLDLPAAAEAEWFERAWWGLWAGDIFSRAVHSPLLHESAMRIIDSPSPGAVGCASQGSKGLILAGAHLGPPRACLAWLIHQQFPLLAWADSNLFPHWEKFAAHARIVRAADAVDSVAAAQRHLRRGGRFFAAIDGGSNRRVVHCQRYKALRPCSPAIPELARRIGISTVRLLALWRGNRIAIESELIPLPDMGLAAEEWNRQWMEEFWRSADGAVKDTPENLRILMSWPGEPIRKETGL